MDYTRLTDYFTYDEIIYDEIALRHGINNQVPIDAIEITKKLYDETMGPIQDVLGPIRVVSGYRSRLLNQLKGGNEGSKHIYSNMRGAACDFVKIGYENNYKLALDILNIGVEFDQMILEFPSSLYSGWIHISIAGLTDSNNKILAIKERGIPYQIIDQKYLAKISSEF